MRFPHNGHAAGSVGVQGAEEFAGGRGVGGVTKVFSLGPEGLTAVGSGSARVRSMPMPALAMVVPAHRPARRDISEL